MVETRQQRRGIWHAATWALIVVGVVARIWILTSPAGRLDSDEAVVGLMGRWIADGHRPPLFFWGQHYGGTLEPMLVAFALKVHQGRFAVKLVPILLSAAASMVLARGARTVLPVAQARVGGALLWASPGTLWLSTKERGFYWVSLLLVTVAIMNALRILTAPESRNRHWFTHGAVCGLAWYTTSQSAYVLVPLTVWLVVTHRPGTRALFTTFGGAMLGAAPWIWGVVQHGSALWHQEPSGSTYAQRLRVVTSELLPRILGVRKLFDGWVLGPIGVVAYLAVVVIVVAYTVRRVTHPVDRLVRAVGLPFVLLVAVPNLAIHASEPRYALGIVPVLALFAARRIASERMLVVALISVVVFAVTGVAHTVSLSNDPATPLLDVAPTSLAPVERALVERGIVFVYADYWLANPLTFRGAHHIVATPLDAPRVVWAQIEVDSARSTRWLAYTGSARDRAIPGALRERGIAVRREVLGAVVLYTLDRYLNPLELGSFWAEYPAGR